MSYIDDTLPPPTRKPETLVFYIAETTRPFDGARVYLAVTPGYPLTVDRHCAAHFPTIEDAINRSKHELFTNFAWTIVRVTATYEPIKG